MKKDDLLFWLGFFVVIAFAAVVLIGYYENKTRCEQRGGQLLRTAFGSACVKVEVLE